MNSLVIQTSFIGDVVLTTPLIAHLATRGAVDVVTTPRGAGVLENHAAIRRIVVWDKRGRDAGMTGLRRIAASVRSTSATDTAWLAQGSVRSALLARLAGYRNRIGFDTSGGRIFYTQRVAWREDQHHAERLLRLAVGPEVDLPGSALLPSLTPGRQEEQAVDHLLASVAESGAPLVALAPGSIWGTKRWPGYPDLARRLAGKARLVVVGSADDASLAAAIVQAAGGAALDATGRLSILGSAELIRRCELLVTNDSSPQHLASAMRTRTLTIYGPTVVEFGFGPLAPGSETVGHPSLYCRPCDRHGPPVCPLGHFRCMRELDAGDMAVRVMRMLSQRGA